MSGMALAARPPLAGRLSRAGAIGLGLLAMAMVVTAPMGAEGQAALTVSGIAAFLVLNRFKSRRVSLVLVVLSIAVTTRYLFWRWTDTLEFDTVPQTFLGTGLFLAELYAGLLLALAYLQTAYPLERKPVPLPADPLTWPAIDVFVPSYNESLDLVRPTVSAALNMDWPRDKLNVWILDDGRRDEFRAFADECGCGYIIRPDNLGAKAGNINHALRHTTGEFIAIFDCDHAPTRAFLQLTVGWLVRDARLAMVQTPHHFYSPDPFERNLARKRRVPNEGLLFYGLIQQGNDLWNAAFFCGSCAVIRRAALEEVGGVPHETVTEDCHCSFRMQKRGWHTAYLRIPLAAGLATERLALHIGQRMRWARGMLQILRIENTLFARGLGMQQRLCYFMASFSFMFAIPRIVFLTSPLAFLFLGQNIIAASPLAIIAYAGSHMFHAIATPSRLNGGNRHSFWSEIYEASLALPLIPVTLMTLWNPRKGKFNVTDKGGTLEQGYLDLRAVSPNMVLLGLLLIGFGIGLHGIATAEGLEFQAYLLNSIWCGMCLIPVSAGVSVGREREQSRVNARVRAVVPVELLLSSGARVAAHSDDISISGARLTIDRPLGVADGDRVQVAFATCGERIVVRATLLHWEGNIAFLRFIAEDIAEEAAVARLFFGRPDAWLHWDAWPKDRPLKALADVVLATVEGVFRKYRFAVAKSVPRKADPARAQLARVSDVVKPRQDAAAELLRRAAIAMLCLATTPALAAALPDGAREEHLTLKALGLRAPMQLRGTSDLQGVLFGLRADEVVTAARLTVRGASSPSLIPSLSQVAVTLNEQAVGTVQLDPARQTFGPVEFPLDPLFFSEANRLNFRFSGRYAVECNDPLSSLLWATISDLSTVDLRIERLPPIRDLARLPEPLFDRRELRAALALPFVIPEAAGPAGLRAAAVAASWFAVQADYRGASFPVERAVPAHGNAVVIAAGPDAVSGLSLPHMDGPLLALIPNPNDAFGTLLVVGGRTEAEAVAASLSLVAGRAGLAGGVAQVAAPQFATRAAYAGPRWLASDHAVSFGSLIDRADLQAAGFASGSIRVPVRTPPDLYTWRNRGLPIEVRYRAPPGPIVDVSTSRLDVSLSDSFLRSFPLADTAPWWPVEWATRQVGGHTGSELGHVTVPPYLLLGREELRLRFDMRPLARGDCAAVPGDIHAEIDPESSIDISRAYHYARLPNLGMFASAGYPFTRFADMSETAAVLPERPNTVEMAVFLDLVGTLAAIVGTPATGLQVVAPGGLRGVAGRDLLVIGALGRQPALATLLRGGPLRVEGNRLSVTLPDAMPDFRALFGGGPPGAERTRASLALDAAGDGMGALVAVESPLEAGRSVVALTGMTPAAMAAMLAVMRDPETSASVQGDVSILSGGHVSAFRASPGYDVGDLPWWLRPQLALGDRPERAAAMLLGAAFLLGVPFYWMMRRRAATRLRGRATRR